MSCEHRFLNDLTPQWKLKYLFIGTFNPSWNRPNGDNANWFYGRRNNDFWFIMPQVIEQPSLMHRDYRGNRSYLMGWCQNNQIGITDLISEIKDADINNADHYRIISSVNDNEFDQFNNIVPTNITDIINKNSDSLIGVYLTRYTHTLPIDGIINTYWKKVEKVCQSLDIHFSPLVTPSRNFRIISREQKLANWKTSIKTVHK